MGRLPGKVIKGLPTRSERAAARAPIGPLRRKVVTDVTLERYVKSFLMFANSLHASNRRLDSYADLELIAIWRTLKNFGKKVSPNRQPVLLWRRLSISCEEAAETSTVLGA